MAKYQFHRLTPDSFEQMVQALLEPGRRAFGTLTQFGPGQDGAREATWTQPPDHPDYVDSGSGTKEPHRWIFQVKFHELSSRGWKAAGEAVLSDLKAELQKIVQKHSLECDHYILITNVPFSGSRHIGFKDRAANIAREWKKSIGNVQLWDATDVSRMLDNNLAVRSAYTDLILPGDAIAAIFDEARGNRDRRAGTLRGYLRYIIDNESQARTEEAGDEDHLPLHKVFIDQTLKLDRTNIPDCHRETIGDWEALSEEGANIVPSDLDEVPASFALLSGAEHKSMLLAGPGRGKSTITQFLVLYHASRLLNSDQAVLLANRLGRTSEANMASLDASCPMRIPFRVELRRYAKWRRVTPEGERPGGLASYIVRQLIGSYVSSTLSEDDIFKIMSENPALLVLDGLDEVPNKESRDEILTECAAFLYRCEGEGTDLQVIMSSRPQGYHGEFERFEPLTWEITDLDAKQFNAYCSAWLAERIKNVEERQEAAERIKRGMTSMAIRRLATTLLQATVMLTIVRRRSDIPEERHALFQKYVDVVFQREKGKSEIIARYEQELMRLHEVVGYRIHEAVGRGDEGSIPAGKFKELVRETWHLVRGDDEFRGVPNQECEAIAQLATNRLVFLSGKGRDQTDIDFVIQPYREYFAAQYLNLHTDANADAVFECLVERGAFWANVLQFYVALAKPALQLAWVLKEPEEQLSAIDTLIVQTQHKRAALTTLPESTRFSFAQLKRAIDAVMPVPLWWTWHREEWAIATIGALRSGDAIRHLLTQAEMNGTATESAVRFAISFLPQAVGVKSPEADRVSALLSQYKMDGRFTRDAIVAAIRSDIPIDVADGDDGHVMTGLRSAATGRRGRPPARNSILSKLSRASLFKAYSVQGVRGTPYGDTPEPWKLAGLPVHISEPYVVANDDKPGVMAPTWLRSHGTPTDTIEGAASCVLEEYLRVCHRLLCGVDDPKVYASAQALEEKIAGLDWRLTTAELLGPPISDFQSENGWSNFRREAREFFKANEGSEQLRQVFLQDGGSRHTWIALLLHPSDWDLLAQYGLLTSEDVQILKATHWAQLLEYTRQGADLLRIGAAPAIAGKPNFPIEALYVVRDAHVRGRLRDNALHYRLFEMDFRAMDGQAMSTFLETLPNAESLPLAWAGTLLAVALSLPGISIHVLIEYWSRIDVGHIWFQPGLFERSTELLSLVDQLLVLDSDAAIRLAGMIVAHMPNAIGGPRKLGERLIALLADARESEPSKQSTRMLLWCVSHCRVTVVEIGRYAMLEWFLAMREKVPDFVNQVADRLSLIPTHLPREEFGAARAHLEIMARSVSYPPNVAASALNALIDITVMGRAPLSEAMWQGP